MGSDHRTRSRRTEVCAIRIHSKLPHGVLEHLLGSPGRGLAVTNDCASLQLRDDYVHQFAVAGCKITLVSVFHLIHLIGTEKLLEVDVLGPVNLLP